MSFMRRNGSLQSKPGRQRPARSFVNYRLELQALEDRIVLTTVTAPNGITVTADVPLEQIFWNGGPPINPASQFTGPHVVNEAPPPKYVSITNTTNDTIYPILRGPNDGKLASQTNPLNPSGYYDPQDWNNQEFRAYLGYVDGGVNKLGVPGGATITFKVPLVFWDSSRLFVVTDGKDLIPDPANPHAPNPFRWNVGSQRGVSVSGPADSWVSAYDGKGTGTAGLVMFYHATVPEGISPDAPAQLTEFTIRAPYLTHWITEADPAHPAETNVVLNYDVSYVDSLMSSIAMEAKAVPVPIADVAHPPTADYGWAGADLKNGSPTEQGTMQALINDFIKNQGDAQIGEYFGPNKPGWPVYYNPNGVLSIPSGANIFPNSPLNNNRSSYDNNFWMLSSGGKGPVELPHGGRILTTTTFRLNYDRNTQKADWQRDLTILQTWKDANQEAFARSSDTGAEFGKITNFKKYEEDQNLLGIDITVNGQTSGPELQSFILYRTVSDYATTAIANLWYSWSKFYVDQFKNVQPPTGLQGSIAAGTNLLVLDNVPSTLAVGMSVTGPGMDAAPNSKVRVLGINTSGVRTITVPNGQGGSGYTSPPDVLISGGGGGGALAKAIVAGGVVTKVIVTSAGTGYTSAPTIEFQGGGGTGAQATATIGTVINVSQLSPGGTGSYNFANPEPMAFSDPTGVMSIKVTNPGSGYDEHNPPAVTITGNGTGATAKAVVIDGKISEIAITHSGTGYTTAPTVTIAGNATATATVGTFVKTFDLKFPQDQQKNAVRFASSVYAAMIAEADIPDYTVKTPRLPAPLSLVYTIIGADIQHLPNSNTGKSQVGANVRDLIKSVLRGVHDFNQVPESQWYPNPATWEGGQRFNVYNLDPYVWFVHEVLKLSGYGFSVDDDTADVGAYASNYTPLHERVEPNYLYINYSGLGNLPNQKKWYTNVQWGEIKARGVISNPTSGPLAGKTIITLDPEFQTEYWKVQPPGPDLIGAFVLSSDNSIPPGTRVIKQEFSQGLVFVLGTKVGNSGNVEFTFTGAHPANPVRNSGFEVPFLTQTPPANYQANIPNNQWSFTKTSGIAGNGSSYTFPNGPAPEGKQVAFIQAKGSISQQVTLQAGTYVISFYGAQRQRKTTVDKQTVNIFVNDAKVSSITPGGPNYTGYNVTFTVPAGTHTIRFVGAVAENDPMVLIDNVSITVKQGGAAAADPAPVNQPSRLDRSRQSNAARAAKVLHADAEAWAVLYAEQRRAKQAASLFQ